MIGVKCIANQVGTSFVTGSGGFKNTCPMLPQGPVDADPLADLGDQLVEICIPVD